MTTLDTERPQVSEVETAAPHHDADALSVLDLFAGAGGLSLGFHQASARYSVVRAVEHDIAAAATYTQNFGDVVFHGDIQDWLDTETVPKVDVVIGGPPCQGFSLIGKQDPDDARNTLWKQYAETVRLAEPRAFVMENVPAFITSTEFEDFQTFAASELPGFEIRAKILNAADFGAPQVRRRAIVIGARVGSTHPGHPSATVDTPSTVREAFTGVRPFAGHLDLPPRRTTYRDQPLPGPFVGPDLHVTRDWSALYMERIRAIPYGGSRHDLPDDLSMGCWRNNPHSAGDVMGRLEWEKPSVTIRTEFFKPEKGRFLHPTQHRTITHWEAARLQGFPDDYRWVGDRTRIARQIGNAVPVQLGEALARHLLAFF